MQNIYGNILLQPTVLFDGVRDGRRTTILAMDIDLSVARSLTGTGANAALAIVAAGDSFYCDQDLDNGGVFDVHFQDSQLAAANRGMTARPGFIARVPFTQFMVTNAAQAGKVARVFYGVNMDFVPGASGSTLVSGTVSVVDGGKTRTLLGTAGIGVGSAGIVAGQYPYVQLLNPVGSGKNIFLESYIGSDGSAGVANLRAYNVALTASGTLASKLIGGAALAGEIRTGNSAASLGTVLMGGYFAANSQFAYKFTEPLALAPGQGVVVQGASAGQITAVFEAYVEDV